MSVCVKHLFTGELMILTKCAPDEPVDQSESGKILCDDVTAVFTVKKYGSMLKHQIFEWSLVQNVSLYRRALLQHLSSD